MLRDLICSVVLALVAIVYYSFAGDIGRSALADEVGPGGLPVAYAVVLGGLALALAAKSIVQLWLAAGRSAEPTGDARQLGFVFRRAAGVLAIGIAYLVIVSVVGYVVAIALAIAAMALYQGARPAARVALIAGAGALAFWLLFDRVLGIPMPASSLF